MKDTLMVDERIIELMKVDVFLIGPVFRRARLGVMLTPSDGGGVQYLHLDQSTARQLANGLRRMLDRHRRLLRLADSEPIRSDEGTG